ANGQFEIDDSLPADRQPDAAANLRLEAVFASRDAVISQTESGRRIPARLIRHDFTRYAGLFIQDYDRRTGNDRAAAVRNCPGDGGSCSLGVAIDAGQKQKQQSEQNDFMSHRMLSSLIAFDRPVSDDYWPGLRAAGSRISSRYFCSSEGAHTSSRITPGRHFRDQGPSIHGLVYVAGSVSVIVMLIVSWSMRL